MGTQQISCSTSPLFIAYSVFPPVPGPRLLAKAKLSLCAQDQSYSKCGTSFIEKVIPQKAMPAKLKCTPMWLVAFPRQAAHAEGTGSSQQAHCYPALVPTPLPSPAQLVPSLIPVFFSSISTSVFAEPCLFVSQNSMLFHILKRVLVPQLLPDPQFTAPFHSKTSKELFSLSQFLAVLEFTLRRLPPPSVPWKSTCYGHPYLHSTARSGGNCQSSSSPTSSSS